MATTELLLAENDRLRTALSKISAIRDSIVGSQTVNISEHIYPLVAILDAAGYTGIGYEAARRDLGTLLQRAEKAERERDEARRERDAARAALDAVDEALVDEDAYGGRVVTIAAIIHERDVAKAFHDVAVKERDHERVRADRMEARAETAGRERDEARAEIAALREAVIVYKDRNATHEGAYVWTLDDRIGARARLDAALSDTAAAAEAYKREVRAEAFEEAADDPGIASTSAWRLRALAAEKGRGR